MVINKEKFKLLFSHDYFNCVSVVNGEDPYSLTLNALRSLDFDFSQLIDKSILIKPNAGRWVGSHTGINTSPEVIAGIIDFLKEKGLQRISVGESPILGVKALDTLEKCGISEVAKIKQVQLIDLDARKPEIIDIPNPRVIKNLKVCVDVLEHDFVISVPVIKTHMHTQVSLGLKNMKGCLYRREKVNLHQLPPADFIQPPSKPLDMAIADLSKILLPDLTITDGTICQEGLGPSAGSIKKFGVVIASFNCLAADWVTAELMGFNPMDVHHLRFAIKENIDGDNPFEIFKNKLKIFPEHYLSLKTDFEPPPKKISFEYSNVNVEDIDSCSACLSSVMLFLKRYQNEIADYYTKENPLKICIGKGIGEQEPGALLVGNCTAHRKKNCVLVKGCPPVASEILKAMEKNIKK